MVVSRKCDRCEINMGGGFGCNRFQSALRSGRALLINAVAVTMSADHTVIVNAFYLQKSIILA